MSGPIHYSEVEEEREIRAIIESMKRDTRRMNAGVRELEEANQSIFSSCKGQELEDE